MLVANRRVVGRMPESCHQLPGRGARPPSHRPARVAEIVQRELGEARRSTGLVETGLPRVAVVDSAVIGSGK